MNKIVYRESLCFGKRNNSEETGGGRAGFAAPGPGLTKKLDGFDEPSEEQRANNMLVNLWGMGKG